MKIFDLLTCRFSDRGKALTLYKRGMSRAKKRDHRGAIDDYTSIIHLPDTPSDVRAMALYNRALAYVAAGDDRLGSEDLDAVLAMDNTPVNVRSMAKQKQVRMESRAAKDRPKQRASRG